MKALSWTAAMLATGATVLAAAASIVDPYAPRVTAYAPLAKDGLEQLSPQMQEALTRWLEAHPPLRTIKVLHCDLMRQSITCEQMLHDGSPYVAVGDFNWDGHDDFAVLLERTLNAGPDTLVVFNGPLSTATQAALVTREGIDATKMISIYGGQGFSIDGDAALGFDVRPTDGGYEMRSQETGEE
ncbi:MAG: hypothetical protein SGI91_20560 [Alphaproteobacteria bacterium]|nr:hypothetical protein [Alphaproteobacteria bacterium]